jgi:hypothetical protein
VSSSLSEPLWFHIYSEIVVGVRKGRRGNV